MDYLNRLDEVKHLEDSYYEVVRESIAEKIDLHYKRFSHFPRYILAGYLKLWEISKILFLIRDTLYTKVNYEHHSQIYEALLRSSENYLLGLKIIVVDNDPDMLEVV